MQLRLGPSSSGVLRVDSTGCRRIVRRIMRLTPHALLVAWCVVLNAIRSNAQAIYTTTACIGGSDWWCASRALLIRRIAYVLNQLVGEAGVGSALLFSTGLNSASALA